MNTVGNLVGKIFSQNSYEKISDPRVSAQQSRRLQQRQVQALSTSYVDPAVLQRLAIRVVEFPAKARAELIAKVGTTFERLPLVDSPQTNYHSADRQESEA